MLVEFSCKKCRERDYFTDLKEAIKDMCPRCGSKEIITWDDEVYSKNDEDVYDKGGQDNEDD